MSSSTPPFPESINLNTSIRLRLFRRFARVLSLKRSTQLSRLMLQLEGQGKSFEVDPSHYENLGTIGGSIIGSEDK